MSFTNRDWQQATGSSGVGGSLGGARPKRDPATRALIRPFAPKAAAPVRAAAAERAILKSELLRAYDRGQAEKKRWRQLRLRYEDLCLRSLPSGKSEPMPRTVEEALRRGITIHDLREAQRRGELPRS